jgi:hypothetical protein
VKIEQAQQLSEITQDIRSKVDATRALVEEVRALVIGLETDLDKARAEREEAYSQRNLVVALLARLAASSGWPVWVSQQAGGSIDDRFQRVVYVMTPEGQLSWHFPEDESANFDGLPTDGPAWDGHTTPEKHDRIMRLITQIDRLQAQLNGRA